MKALTKKVRGRNFVFLSFLLLFFPLQLTCSPTSGQKNNAPQITDSRLPPPEPSRLEPRWWDYYDVDPELLRKRIERTKISLSAAKQHLNIEQQAKADPLVERILIGLETLYQLKSKHLEIQPSFPAFAQSYDLEQFVLLGKNLQEREQQLRLIQLKITLRKESIRSGSHYLDILVASYLAEAHAQPQKILQGLEIMATRIAVMIEENQLVDLEAREINQQKRVDVLQSEVEYAREHLNFSPDSLTYIDSKIEELEEELIAARYELYSAQLASLKTDEESIFPELQREIAAQKLTDLAVAKAIVEMELINFQMMRWIYVAATDLDSEDLNQLHTDLNTWKNQVSAIKRDIPDWEDSTELDLERVLKGLSHIGEQDSALLNQKRELYQSELTTIKETLLKLQTLQNESYLHDFLIVQLKYLISEAFSSPIDRVTNAWHAWVASLQSQSKWFRQSFFKVGQTPITPFAILKLILIIGISYLLGKAVQKWIKHFGQTHRSVNQGAIYTLSRLAYFTIFYLGIIIAFSSIGIDFTAFAFVAGAITFWLGLGFINIVQNFVAGIILLLDKNMRVGDYIQLSSGEKGTITDINMRNTMLSTPEGLKILVPNIEFIMNKCTNWTLSGRSHRVSVPFKVAYGNDKNDIRKLIVEAAKKVPITASDREPQVWLANFGEKALEFELIVWVNEYLLNKQTMSSQSIYLWSIDSTLHENGISIITKQHN